MKQVRPGIENVRRLGSANFGAKEVQGDGDEAKVRENLGNLRVEIGKALSAEKRELELLHERKERWTSPSAICPGEAIEMFKLGMKRELAGILRRRSASLITMLPAQSAGFVHRAID